LHIPKFVRGALEVCHGPLVQEMYKNVLRTSSITDSMDGSHHCVIKPIPIAAGKEDKLL